MASVRMHSNLKLAHLILEVTSDMIGFHLLPYKESTWTAVLVVLSCPLPNALVMTCLVLISQTPGSPACRLTLISTDMLPKVSFAFKDGI